MPLAIDLQRLEEEYVNREQRLVNSDIYSIFNASYLFIIQQRQRRVLSLLKKNGFDNLSSRSILEVGCGSGGVLFEFLGFGADAKNLHGIDLLPVRLTEALDRLPYSKLSCADGQNLPYPSGHFDLVLQYTAFSSILDTSIKRNVANEMLRVTKYGGMILWYDFWINPTNKQTRGIGPNEIRSLFPNCRYDFHKITLAPPISRIIAPISWIPGIFLESLQIFNSHYLVTIHPQ